MKKILTLIVALFLSTAVLTQAAPMGWDFNANVLQPISAGWNAVVRGSSFTATSTTATSTLPVLDVTTRLKVGTLEGIARTTGGIVSALKAGLNFSFSSSTITSNDSIGAGGSASSTLYATDSLQMRTISQLKDFKTWAGNSQIFIGEFGTPKADSQYTDNEKLFIKAMNTLGIPATYWAAGEFWGTYNLLPYEYSGGILSGNPIAQLLETHQSNMRGVNVAGAEFGIAPGVNSYNNSNPGTLNVNYFWPSTAYLQAIVDRGTTIVRIPFTWERIQPTLGGTLDATYLAALKSSVNYLRDRNVTVLLDVHNYGSYRTSAGNFKIGSATTTQAHFNNLWTRLNTEFGTSTNVWYGLMNEPANLTYAEWEAVSSSTVAALRVASSTNKIVVALGNYSGLQGLSSHAAGPWIVNGGDIMYEGHSYHDADYSGDYSESYASSVTTASGQGYSAGYLSIGEDTVRATTIWGSFLKLINNIGTQIFSVSSTGDVNTAGSYFINGTKVMDSASGMYASSTLTVSTTTRVDTGYTDSTSQGIAATAGDVIVVSIAGRKLVNLTSVTANGVAMTAPVAHQSVLNTTGAVIYYAVATSTGTTTVVVNTTGNFDQKTIVINTVTGLDTTNLIVTSYGAVNYYTSDNRTFTTGVGDVLFEMFAAQGGGVFTIPSASTVLTNTDHSDANMGATAVTYKVATALTTSSLITPATSDNMARISLVFKRNYFLNYLPKNNTIVYTPTAAYHPATKAYVDSLISTSSGSGDVVGPSSATANAIARYNSTTGKLIKNSGLTLGDNNGITGILESGNGLVYTGTTTGNMIKLTPSGALGNNLQTSGAFNMDMTDVLDGIAFQVYTNSTGTSVTYPQILLQANNASYNNPLLQITHKGTGGNAAHIRLDGPSPQIEWRETDGSGSAGNGQFETQVQGDIFFINGRNAPDTSFDNAVWFLRPELGGSMGLGTNPYTIEKLTLGDTTGGSPRIAMKGTTGPSATTNYGKFWTDSTTFLPKWMNSTGSTTDFALSSNGLGTNGQVLQSNGTTSRWVATSSLGITGGGGFSDPLTTNGDIIARISGATTRLPQGSNGTFLGVSGGVLGYYSTGAGSQTPWTQNIDGAGFNLSNVGTTTSTVIVAGTSTAPGIVTSNGSQNLVLRTGNATTGSITIAPGADADMTIAPNGNGSVIITKNINTPSDRNTFSSGVQINGSFLALANNSQLSWNFGNTTLTHSADLLTLSKSLTVASTTNTTNLNVTSTTSPATFAGGVNISGVSTIGTTTGTGLQITSLGVGKSTSASIRSEILTNSTFTQGMRVEGDTTTRLGVSSFVTGDAQVRFTQSIGGQLDWGPGTAVADTRLYRISTSTLRTDAMFSVGGTSTLATTTVSGLLSATSPSFTTSVVTPSVSFTAYAGATTLLTIGGTGASASMFMPSTLDTTSAVTGAIRTSGGISAAKALNIGTTGTFGTSVTNPIYYGGSAVSSVNNIRSTSGAGTSDAIVFGTGNNGAITAGRINTQGTWSIGTTSSSSLVTIASTTANALSVFGTTTLNNGVVLAGLPTNTAGNAVCIVGTALVTAGNTTCVTSSERFKKDITPLNNWRDLLDIDVVEFNYKDGYADPVRDAGGKRLGFIAEQVNEIDPALVQFDADGKPLSVHFDGITAKTVLAIQEIQKEIDGMTGKAKQSAQDNWQWIAIGILFFMVGVQQYQINRLKK